MPAREIAETDISSAAMKSGLPLETVRQIAAQVEAKRATLRIVDLPATLRNWCQREAAKIVRTSTQAASTPLQVGGDEFRTKDPSSAFYAALPCICDNCRWGRAHDFVPEWMAEQKRKRAEMEAARVRAAAQVGQP